MSAVALCIFAKLPQLGRVKTRLAADLGDQAALRIYIQLLQHTINIDYDGPRYLFFTGDHAQDYDPRDAVPLHFPQQGSDLGSRLSYGLQFAIAEHGAAVAIGTDCPGLTCEAIKELVDAIDNKTVAIGPAEDGGYWGIGFSSQEAMRLCCASDLPWSQSTLRTETIQRCHMQGFNTALTSSLYDVDTTVEYNRALTDKLLTTLPSS